MENPDPSLKTNQEANQLPEADSLPDGFVDSSSADPLGPELLESEEEKRGFTDYKEEKLVEPDVRTELAIDELHLGKSSAVVSEGDGSKKKSDEPSVVPGFKSAGSGCVEELLEGKCQSSERSKVECSDPQVTDSKGIISPGSTAENNKKEASEVKRKSAKRSFKSEKEFLEFTLKYQQVLAERVSSIAVRDKLESLCRELQRQNKMLMMETMDAPKVDVSNLGGNLIGNGTQSDDFKHSVDELVIKVDKLEQEVNEVEQLHLNTTISQPSTSRSTSAMKCKDKERQIPSFKKLQKDSSRREAGAAKRMQDLMRQFGSILRQITQHKWAWPFMQPVDVEGLGLHDYYEVIDRPMDFSTIKNQMEAKDGTGYKHVREICADVRLVFENAMKYNDEKSDVHVMAKKLLEKFEEKWLQLLPKVTEEEKRREEEEAKAQTNLQLAQQAAHAKMARDLSNELYEVDKQLEELRQMVVKNCRKISVEEKRKIGTALTMLCPEDLSKALMIVAQNNPDFQVRDEEVDLDMDAQSESTLWRLKFFVKDALNVHSNGENQNNDASNPSNKVTSKQKRVNTDANTSKKPKKKPAT